MSFRKWLYRKEIEQLKDDLFIFKTRYRIGENILYMVDLTNGIEKYLKAICINNDKFKEKIDEVHGETYIDGYKWVVYNEETFEEYFDLEKWDNNFSRMSFADINYHLRDICIIKKKNNELWDGLKEDVEEGIKRNSTFANADDGQPYYGVTNTTYESHGRDWVEAENQFFMGIIKGIEHSLKNFGCSDKEIDVIDSWGLLWEDNEI